MKKIYIFLILFLIQNTVSAKTINWETTRDQIVSHAYQVELSKIDVDISKTKILGARSEYYPKIGLYAYNEYSKYLGKKVSQVEYIGNEAIYGHDIIQNAISLGLTYNLYDFGIRDDKLKIAKNDNKSKLGTYYKTLRDIEINAIDLYAKALSEIKEIEVKSEILRIQKELYVNKDRLNASGQLDKTKVLSENIKTVELENDIEKIRNEHIKTLKDLSHITREEFSENDIIEDFNDENIYEEGNVLHASVEKNDFLNIENSPEFKIYDTKIEKKKRELLITKKQNLPQFSFSTNYYLYGSDQSSFKDSWEDFGQRGLKFRLTTSLPIFDGFKNKSERDRLKLEILRLQVEKEQKISELKTSYEKITTDAEFSKRQLDNNKRMLELVLSNIAMLDRLNDNKLIDKNSYLNEKINLLKQKLDVQLAQINDYKSAYKLTVINKYENETEKL